MGKAQLISLYHVLKPDVQVYHAFADQAMRELASLLDSTTFCLKVGDKGKRFHTAKNTLKSLH